MGDASDQKIKSFEDLRVWQKAVVLVESIYTLARMLPPDEVYGLSSQLKRAAISIPSNIAEGCSRQHTKQFREFLHISLGSCAELKTQIIIARRLNFINDSVEEDLIREIDEISKMTMGLIKKLRT